METLTKYLAVAVGGAIGACLRYYIGGSFISRTFGAFPSATFLINITGSFIIGFFLTLVTERVRINPHLSLAVAVGFVGSYTTFSTFEYETARLIEDKNFLMALLNVMLSVTVGFIAVWGGIIAAREIKGVPPFSSAAYKRFEREADLHNSAQERDIRDAERQVRRMKNEG